MAEVRWIPGCNKILRVLIQTIQPYDHKEEVDYVLQGRLGLEPTECNMTLKWLSDNGLVWIGPSIIELEPQDAGKDRVRQLF